VSKKIKLSEVESSHRRSPTIEGRYLLDLVERMGDSLRDLLEHGHVGFGPSENDVQEARALLEELKK